MLPVVPVVPEVPVVPLVPVVPVVIIGQLVWVLDEMEEAEIDQLEIDGLMVCTLGVMLLTIGLKGLTAIVWFCNGPQ